MALKDTWTPQDDTMVADPEVVNIIADAVIKNEEDIKDLKENGGGGTTDGITKEYADKTYATKEELGDIETALDSIIAMQNELIGGESV